MTTIFITHDLDEAIRIAIMDGRIVQISTPEEIVTNPCDDYVKKFVAGISRINLVTAHKVMQPLASMTETERSRMGFMQRASPGAKLDELLDIACDSDDAILVCEGEQHLGVISKRTLLRGIQGRQAH